MKNCKNLGTIVCIVYIIVYIVLKVLHRPNFDFFADGAPPPTISLARALAEKRGTMLDQEGKQGDQNKRISELKLKIDALRNDLTIIKSKEQEELSSIHNKISGTDSLAEALSVDGGKAMSRMLGGKGEGSKNYNLNFNLDEE